MISLLIIRQPAGCFLFGPDARGSMASLLDLPGHLIRRMHQIAVSTFAAEVAAEGCDITNVQYATLFTLRAHPGIDQATLAGLIAYDRVTIGGVIARLEARGYLERVVSRTDRRARSLRLTPAGAAVLDAVNEGVLRAQQVMLQGLDAAEQKTLLALLRKATEAGNELSRAPMRPVDAGQTGPRP